MSTAPERNPPSDVPALSVLVNQAQFAAVSEQIAKTLVGVTAAIDQTQLAAVSEQMAKTLAGVAAVVEHTQLAAANEQIAKSLSSWTSVVPSLTDFGKFFRAWDPKRLRRYWVENAPENWAQLDNEWLDIFDVVESTGLCVVWAPGDAIMREMIAATDPEDCLVQNRDQVLADVEIALQRAYGVPIAGHADACEFAAEAVASARDGRSMATQALAACGFATVLHISHGINFARARHQFQIDLGDATIGTMRASAIEFCSHQALAQHKPGDPPPVRYARHATHHGARGNFSEANALSSLLLLVAWLRELKWIEEHDPAALAAFSPI